MDQDYKRYLLLCRQIWEHNKHYYIEQRPVITDKEYDQLFRQLEETEKLHPDWIHSGSPTQRVGESLTEGFKTVGHRIPMLSLANTYSKEELQDFVKRMVKLVEKSELVFSCELKMDGIAISATYEKGIFVRGVTRGNGQEGDEITQNMRTIATLPLQIYGKDLPDFLEIRGEVFMTHDVFSLLNVQRASRNEPLWANPRNAAAGSLKLLDPHEVARRKLSIVFYGIAEDSSGKLRGQFEIHDLLNQWGLPILPHVIQCHSLEEIWNFAEKIRDLRPHLPFDIDGIVIKLNDLNEQKRLGSTGKNPRWAVAYKFAAEQAFTRIKEITVQVGRTGVLTPVAELEPVFLAGSTIARATLHNQDEIERKDIRVGDMACIEKGGDVIPKVVGIDFSHRSPESQEWMMPQFCPSCKHRVVKSQGEVAYRCPNPICPEQQLRRIIYFVGKDALDIDGMGEKVVEQLMERGFVKKASDIFCLQEQQLRQLEGFKDKSVQNLMRSIEKSRKVTLARFIMGLGIKYVGTGTSELLAKKSGSIEKLMCLSREELMQIDGIGEKVATAVEEYFSRTENREEVLILLQLGVVPEEREVKKYQDHPFHEKHFVLTGTLTHFTRNSAATLIKERGGIVLNAINKKTNFLIAGENPGSKLEKSLELRIKVLSEDEFIKML